jgi:type IV pilus assembly protein PilA
MNMKKMLRENKGFSLVELLVAILIMAVIAGTAITLFGGVLNSSRENADKETAESIKRAVLTYMNSTNDVNLSCLNVSDGTDSSLLIEYLGLQVTIPTDDTTDVSYDWPGTVTSATTPGTGVRKDPSDFTGTFGPFLDLTKDMAPKTPNTQGWIIDIDSDMQVVDVQTTDVEADAVVSFVSSSSGT